MILPRSLATVSFRFIEFWINRIEKRNQKILGCAFLDFFFACFLFQKKVRGNPHLCVSPLSAPLKFTLSWRLGTLCGSYAPPPSQSLFEKSDAKAFMTGLWKRCGNAKTHAIEFSLLTFFFKRPLNNMTTYKPKL